ncbi:MAG: hypothetical protein WAL72_38525 [Streptosporangiaceae bacterium]
MLADEDDMQAVEHRSSRSRCDLDADADGAATTAPKMLVPGAMVIITRRTHQAVTRPQNRQFCVFMTLITAHERGANSRQGDG